MMKQRKKRIQMNKLKSIENKFLNGKTYVQHFYHHYQKEG
jgi:hypothetical protein